MNSKLQLSVVDQSPVRKGGYLYGDLSSGIEKLISGMNGGLRHEERTVHWMPQN